MIKDNLGKERLTYPDHHPSKRETSAEFMEECYLLSCSLWFAQFSFFFVLEFWDRVSLWPWPSWNLLCTLLGWPETHRGYLPLPPKCWDEREVAPCLASLASLPSYTVPLCGTGHSGLDPPRSVRLALRPAWWKHLLSWGFLSHITLACVKLNTN